MNNDAVEIEGGDGFKLMSDHPTFGDGIVSVDLKFAKQGGENAGLIVRVSDPKEGPDAFYRLRGIVGSGPSDGEAGPAPAQLRSD